MQFVSGGGMFGRNVTVEQAVDEVSFDVYRGETPGIVGESGSGKTTLGRCIMHILDLTSGSVYFNRNQKESIELVDCDAKALRSVWRDLRMVFQDP